MLSIGRKENFIVNHFLGCIATFHLWEILGDSLFPSSKHFSGLLKGSVQSKVLFLTVPTWFAILSEKDLFKDSL